MPSLKVEARPSKHAIVDASISYHRAQQARCLRTNQALQSILTERDDLLREVNALRALCQPVTFVPRQARPVDPAVLGMMAESKVSAVDLTREQGSIDKLPEISQQMVGRSLTGSHPGESLSVVPQGSLIDSSAALQHPDLSHTPDGQSLAILNNGMSPINSSEWDWEESNKICQQMVLHPPLMDEAALLWSQPTENPTATPPQGAGSGYTASPVYLLDDATHFWTQDPGVMNAMPPSDSVPFESQTISTSWHPHPPTLSILPQEANRIAIHQMRNSVNSFSSDPESLSIPMGDMIGNDPVNPSATLCSATN